MKAREYWNEQKNLGVWTRPSPLLEPSLTEFRKLAMESGQDEGIWEEASQTLIRLLQNPQQLSEKALFEALWILTNIAAGESPRSQILIDHGVLEIIGKVTSRNSKHASLQACWLLGNLAAESVSTRAACITKNMQLLMPGWRHFAEIAFDREVWHHTLSQLLMAKPKLNQAAFNSVWPVVLSDWRSFPEERANMVAGLSGLVDLNSGWLRELQRPEDLASLGSLALAGNNHALLVLGEFCTGDEAQTDVALRANIIPLIQQRMAASPRKDHLWILSNIAAGSRAQAELLFSLPELWLPPGRVTQLQPELLREWCWVMSNLSTYVAVERLGPYLHIFKAVQASDGCPPVLASELGRLVSKLESGQASQAY